MDKDEQHTKSYSSMITKYLLPLQLLIMYNPIDIHTQVLLIVLLGNKHTKTDQ